MIRDIIKTANHFQIFATNWVTSPIGLEFTMFPEMLDDNKWQDYLAYLYRVAERSCDACTDIDSLVQDTLTVMIVRLSEGERIEHPKGFLSAVLKNKYNSWLREKYKAEIVEYTEGAANEMLCLKRIRIRPRSTRLCAGR